MTTPSRLQSRVEIGLCVWVRLARTVDELEELKNADPFTYNKLEELMEVAAEPGGLVQAGYSPDYDYQTPLQYAPDDVSEPPWMGELKTVGKKRKKKAPLVWRLYFGEPIENLTEVVACGVSFKDPEDLKGAEKQRKAVAKAMGHFKWHCSSHGLTYQPF